MDNVFSIKIDRLMLNLLCLLMLAVALSPRIPLPIYIPGRTFDLRIEDIIILLLVFIWISYLCLRPKLYSTPLAKPVLVYFVFGIFSMVIAQLFQRTDFLRLLFYNLKELEYFLIFLLIANWAKSESDLKMITRIIIAGGALNVLWIAFQLVTRNSIPLFSLPLSGDVYSQSSRFERYGVVLIGEVSPFAVACFLSLLSYLAYSCRLYYIKRRRFFLILGIALTIGSMLTGEKISVVFFIVGLIAMFLLNNNDRLKINPKMLSALIILILILFFTFQRLVAVFPDVKRILSLQSYSIGPDRVGQWKLLFLYSAKYFFTGIGKGGQYLYSLGVGEEAHNHYLKVFIETGIFGLLIFIWLLVKIGLLAVSVNKKSVLLVSKVVSAAALCALLGLGAAAFVQDAFKTVLPNELFWAFVGLTAASCKIEKIFSK